jgi:hypothetical protein
MAKRKVKKKKTVKRKTVKKKIAPKPKETFCILVNLDGEEISRTPKVKGEKVSSRGFTKGKGGHYYKTVAVYKEREHKSVSVKKLEETRLRRIKDKGNTTIKVLLDSCNYTEMTDTNKEIVLMNPVFFRESGLETIGNMKKGWPQYTKVVIYKKEKIIAFWTLADIHEDTPTFIITNGLK